MPLKWEMLQKPGKYQPSHCQTYSFNSEELGGGGVPIWVPEYIKRFMVLQLEGFGHIILYFLVNRAANISHWFCPQSWKSYGKSFGTKTKVGNRPTLRAEDTISCIIIHTSLFFDEINVRNCFLQRVLFNGMQYHKLICIPYVSYVSLPM